jgi:hypothetical protein
MGILVGGTVRDGIAASVDNKAVMGQFTLAIM